MTYFSMQSDFFSYLHNNSINLIQVFEELLDNAYWEACFFIYFDNGQRIVVFSVE